MPTSAVVIDFSEQLLDENTLTWPHAVLIRAVRAEVVQMLDGDCGAVLHVHPERCAEILSAYVGPELPRGTRRLPTGRLPMRLGKRERLKVWGIRHHGRRGILRVELEWRALR